MFSNIFYSSQGGEIALKVGFLGTQEKKIEKAWKDRSVRRKFVRCLVS